MRWGKAAVKRKALTKVSSNNKQRYKTLVYIHPHPQSPHPLHVHGQDGDEAAMPCGLGQVQGDLAIEVEGFNPSCGNRRHRAAEQEGLSVWSVKGACGAWVCLKRAGSWPGW